MNHILIGFAKEFLEKKGGLMTALSKPFTSKLGLALTGALIGIPAAGAAYEGMKKGISGEKPRYLQASPSGPSQAFYTPFHQAMPHTMTPAAQRRLGYSYRPQAFKRSAE